MPRLTVASLVPLFVLVTTMAGCSAEARDEDARASSGAQSTRDDFLGCGAVTSRAVIDAKVYYGRYAASAEERADWYRGIDSVRDAFQEECEDNGGTRDGCFKATAIGVEAIEAPREHTAARLFLEWASCWCASEGGAYPPVSKSWTGVCKVKPGDQEHIGP